MTENQEELEYLPYIVLPNLDYDAQLRFIKELLATHKQHIEVTEKSIDDITHYLKNHIKDHSEEYLEYLNDERGEKIHTSIYQSATHSMSAIGMLAPFIESLFYQVFYGIKTVFYETSQHPTDHTRWKSNEIEAWDCHYTWKNGSRDQNPNIVEGIMQLSDAVGLKTYLPSDIKLILTVLFSYRNKMFHCGLEWPIEERKNFYKRIKNERWPENWLSFSKSGDEPWIFYLTDEFIKKCVEASENVILGIAQYVQNKIYEIEQLNKP